MVTVEQKYDLVSRLLAAKPSENEAFEKFKKVFDEDFMAFANKESSLADEAAAVQQLQALEKRLEHIVAFPHMFAKRSVAIGGGFSSGKSEFVNSFIEQPDIELPVGIKPVTAIPSYVMASADVSIKGYTRTGATVDIARDLYVQLSRDFIGTFSFNLKDQMPSIAVEVPLQAGFEHICLIDTPGYNSGSDRETAINSLRDRDALIWMIDVSNGTIPQSDLDFLHAMELNGLPLYVVLSKADNKPPSELKDILAEVKDTLKDTELKPMGIGAYSSRRAKRGQEYPSDGLSLSDFFRRQNQPVENLVAEARRMKAEFQSVFSMYEKAIKQDEKSAKLLMTRLNEIDFDLNDTDADVADKVGEKIDKIKQSQGRDFAPIKQELGQVKKAMLAAVEQVLSSLVQDEERAAELRKAWGQESRSKRRSQSTRRRKPADTQAKDARRNRYALHQAAKHNDHVKAAKLLRQGADPNAHDKGGCTPLCWAAEHNAVATAKVLLKAGAKVNAEDKKGYTPLHWAAEHNAVATAKVLLKEGASVNAEDKKGSTPLHWAAWSNAAGTAKVLLKEGASVNAKDKKGYTPLHEAAYSNAAGTAKVLLKEGASVNARDKAGSTPLHIAAQNNASDVAKELFRHRAYLNAKNHVGRTPLGIARQHKAREMAEILHRRGGVTWF